jgi:hypothetical protein
VCGGVSADVFNRYFADGDYLPIALRFIELSQDGRILIIDSRPQHMKVLLKSLRANSFVHLAMKTKLRNVGQRGRVSVAIQVKKLMHCSGH